MLARIWTATVDEPRADEYEAFARSVSLPMFQRKRGFRGALMARQESKCLVITLWTDESAVAALDASPDYKAVVARILAAGFLGPVQSTSVYTLHDAAFPPDERNPARESQRRQP